MFSISFGEMFMIIMVCLVVVGPKRLPKMARFCGHLLGRINRQASNLKREIRREIELEDLRQAKDEAESVARDVEQVVYDTTKVSDKPSVPGRQS